MQPWFYGVALPASALCTKSKPDTTGAWRTCRPFFLDSIRVLLYVSLHLGHHIRDIPISGHGMVDEIASKQSFQTLALGRQLARPEKLSCLSPKFMG